MSDPSAGVVHSLRKTLPWVRFLGIVGFLIAGLIVVIGVLTAAGFGARRASGEMPPAALLAYPVMAVICFFHAFYLHKYARRITRFVAQGHQVQLESALEAQRQLWTFVGVITAAFAALGGAAFLAALVIGLMAAL